ncbi:class I SAM-dependent methyltransferase [Mesorhizobium sp. BAC0120]|uniref:class I SAM-dependent methyltransferase n=1 Tax=Mesorhizobium sp. BAC0120 TaxID=3090670 RepID=UPI00298CD60B|nr:class I SAM-dependent methyltransferase [Mesorhizobium sp. BAC0120]MDW6025219.1 class I SAM-dependent methyltransferase [Mesorhizobium sp. BAC0120]
MSTPALKTLFHPFESGALDLPEPHARVLFLGAKLGFRTPEGFTRELTAVQGFRPDFLALQREGLKVLPHGEGSDYTAALVLCGRHRGENELNVAEALERGSDGALILIAGSNDDGVASLAKRMGKLIALEGRSPKHHGLAFWFRAPADRLEIAAALRQANATTLVEGRFETSPGMFSYDRVDPGSRLLAEALPQNLSGKVADFCAGWGYLSAELMLRSPGISSIDLYEAEFSSLEAARRNVKSETVPARFFWHDLLAEPVEHHYDAIVMNPPFHQGRAAEPEIGQKLIALAAKALTRRGVLFLVANKGLPYEKALTASFEEYRQIAGDNAFKVFAARR